MNIILDSNVIIQDFRLKGADATLFLNNFSANNNHCFISQVTYLEVIRNYEKQLEQKVAKIKSQLNSIKRQTEFPPFDIDGNYVQTESKKYRQYLDKLLNEYKISILPLPKISHQKVLEFTISDKPPFSSSDNGYKDFLIFNSVIENIQKYNSDVIFITNDSDFGDDCIYPDLAELNNSSKSITLRKSLKEINDNELKQNIAIGNAHLSFVTDLFEDENHSNEYFESVADFLNSRNFLEIYPSHLDIYKHIIKDQPEISGHEFYPDTAEIISVNAINKNLVIVNAKFDAYLAYSFLINSKDLHIFRNLPEEIDLEYDIIEEDALIWLGDLFSVSVSIQSDKAGMEIRNVELKIDKSKYNH